VETIDIIVNGNKFSVEGGLTVLDACSIFNIYIPTLCHVHNLKPAEEGCGLCKVEIAGIKGLQPACKTFISSGMRISTHSDEIIAERRRIIEELLSRHIGDCRPPCQLKCPGEVDIKRYVNLAVMGEWEASLDVLRKNLPLPGSIGRVCPAPCQIDCRRHLVDGAPVSIREIKRMVADKERLEKKHRPVASYIPENGYSVAVVGGGPGGLSAALALRRKGYRTTIFEKEALMGGMMRYGIPDYRLPQDVIQHEIDWIIGHGIEVRTNTELGRDISFDEIKKQYDAVVLAMGCWTSLGMRVKGEKLSGVLGGIDFLYKVNKGETVEVGERIAVIGGGNTAMDACRCALRQGAKKVYCVYRRTRMEMPAEKIEIEEAEEEGVEFIFLAAPEEIQGHEKVEKIIIRKMKLGDPDASGRRSPVPTEDLFSLEVDNVIAAIGQGIDTRGLPESILDGRWMKMTGSFSTSISGAFVCGDQLTGPSIAIAAIGQGFRVAETVDNFLKTGKISAPFACDVTVNSLTSEEFKHIEKSCQEKPRHLNAPQRLLKPFEEYNFGLTEDQAIMDGSRCLRCGCPDIFECRLREMAILHEVSYDKANEELNKRTLLDQNPFFVRDENKCIGCGICERICSERAFIDAIKLGVNDSGFKVARPVGNAASMIDSPCAFCGQCVQACPTGALVESDFFALYSHADSIQTKTICPYCGVGCELILHVDKLTGVLWNITTDPDSNTGVNHGRTCVKGRFAWHFIHSPDRLTKPLIRQDGVLKPATWEKAINFISERFMKIRDSMGPDALAFVASARCTNEENYLMQRFSREIMKSPNIDHCAHL